MNRHLDKGLDKLQNIILDMAEHSEKTVLSAIDAYKQGKNLKEEIYESSKNIRNLENEVSQLSVELIARNQPVASDLRFIKSCMEIAHGFYRFGRYAYDISQVLDVFEDLSICDKSAMEKAANQANKMIKLSIKAFIERDLTIAQKLREMDEVVDTIYLDFVKKAANTPDASLKCSLSGTLILRYIERIADHAVYIGDSVVYIISGKRDLR